MKLTATAYLVPEYEPGIAFLAALGFEPAADEAKPGGGRWVVMRPSGGGSDQVLAKAGGPAAAATGNQAGGRVGMFLAAEGYAIAAARVRSADGHFEEPPRHEPYGTVAEFRDPFGNRRDLIGPTAT